MQIYMLITDDCNLRCKMCIRGESHKENMNFDTLKNLDFLRNISQDTIIITGGEPTLHKDFVKIVKHICKYAKNVAITTNGTLDYYIQDLKEEKNLIFQVSLDGDEKQHDEIRGNGTYKKTINTLMKLEKNNIKYSVASVVNKNNKENILMLIKELKILKYMSYWRISYEMPFGNASFDNMMPIEEWNNLVDCIIKEAEFRVKVQKLFPFELYDKYMTKCDKMDFVANRCFNCGSGKDKVYIYPNFNVYSCTCLTDFCVGNLLKSQLDEILNSEKIKPFLNYTIDDNVYCKKCKYYKVCNGGCIGMSYHFFGVIGKGDMRCPILRRYYEKKNILL